MSKYPTTSMRFSPEELELLEARAAFMSESLGVKHNRTSTIRDLMRRDRPPLPTDEGGLGPQAARFRRAWTTIFGELK